MSATACLHCTAPTEGAALCTRCQHTVLRALGNLSGYHRDLFNLAPPPPGIRHRAERPDPTGGTVARLGGTDPVEDLAARTHLVLVTWMRALIEDRPGVTWPRDEVPAIALRLGQHLRSIATLEWAGEFARQIVRLELDLRRFIERHRERWYAGVCGWIEDPERPEDFCTRVLYADPDSDTVRCPLCRTSWPVAHRREVLLTEARNVETNVATIARALVTLLDNEPSQARLERRIQNWVDRGRLERRGHLDTDGRVRKTYRLGDVLDILMNADQVRGA